MAEEVKQEETKREHTRMSPATWILFGVKASAGLPRAWRGLCKRAVSPNTHTHVLSKHTHTRSKHACLDGQVSPVT